MLKVFEDDKGLLLEGMNEMEMQCNERISVIRGEYESKINEQIKSVIEGYENEKGNLMNGFMHDRTAMMDRMRG